KRGTLISVHITGRYNDWYDFPFLVVIAEWLERRIPHATLWYGPTSGGEVAVEPFGPEERRDIVEGFFARGGGALATAADAIGVLLDHPDLVTPSATFQHLYAALKAVPRPTCTFCQHPMSRVERRVYACRGCGDQQVDEPSGQRVCQR